MVGAMLVNFRIEDTFIEVESQVETVDRTGVEMEALTAATVACLTIYDMCKSVDRSMVIGDIALWEKTGGRSGTFRRQQTAGDDVRSPTVASTTSERHLRTAPVRSPASPWFTGGPCRRSRVLTNDTRVIRQRLVTIRRRRT